jgi:2,5-diketo-D-gluconate reductase A
MTPALSLNDGTTIPQVGFGTLSIQPDRSTSPANVEMTAAIVAEALDAGYRHIDTAQSYGTERGTGLALAASGIPRREVYLTSKLSNANHRPDDVRRSFGETLENLGVEQLDLFLIHWPLPTLYDGDYVSTWRTMVELVADGRLRTAGVSNFLPHHLDRIIAETGAVPAVNQIELHPNFANAAVRDASVERGIVVESWSPLGQGRELDDPVIAAIAAGHGASTAQTILRWHLQHGYVLIPKTTHRARMEENLDLFDFELSAGEMSAIDALDQGEAGRIGPDPDTFAWIPSPDRPRYGDAMGDAGRPAR